jgi:hypothetical protein
MDERKKKCLQNYPKYLDGRAQIGGLYLYGMIILISDLKKYNLRL